RIWRYLTDGRLRRQWLAAGEMEMRIGSALELVWRNDELSDQPTTRPAGFAAEMRMESRVTELDPPRRLAIAWGNSG
ncbi:SRPBCC domain-containing protein, partial [Acinetobacter baumannii]